MPTGPPVTRPAGTQNRRQAGFALAELIVVMAILSIVLAGLTTVFVAGLNAEVDLSRRVDAQIQARLALNHLRRDVHCANSLTTTGSQVTMTLPAQCLTGSGTISWCAVSLGTNRWGLYRKTGATCDATGKRFADFLTTNALFTYYAPSSTSLGKLHVDFPVDIKPASTSQSYRLIDDLVLRNTVRT